MKRHGWYTILGAILILALCIYGERRVSLWRSEAQKAAAGVRDTAITVSTGKVGRADIKNILTFNGDIEALRTVELQPKISGRLQRLQLSDGTPVEEGVPVRQGEQLAQIDEREYHAQLTSAIAAQAAAEAARAVAKANLEQQKSSFASAGAATASAQANLDDKERELTRQKNLVAKQAATQQSLDQATTAFAQAQANLRQFQAEEQAAKAKIASAEAAIQQADADAQQAAAKREEAQLNDDETRIYAPMDGVVTRKYVDPGVMVSPTTPIVSLVSMDTVKVLISIPVNHLPEVTPGKTAAALRTAALPGQTIDCIVGKIYPAVETATRTAQVELRVRNPRSPSGQYLLLPGMYVTVDLLLEERRQVLAVKVSLPVRNLDRHLIFVVKGDTVKAVPVTLGAQFGEWVEIVDGLTEGTEIVTQGQHRLTDGAPIHRVKESKMSVEP